MIRKFQEVLADYFSHVQRFHIAWREVITSLARLIESLRNQLQQLRFAKSDIVYDAEICQINLAREKLIFKINTGIDNEIALIAQLIDSCRNLYQDLRNKYNHLVTLRTEVSEYDSSTLKILREGTITRPQLSLLLQWTTQIHVYYMNFYNMIYQSYLSLNRNDDMTIEKFALSLEEQDITKLKIEKILTLTQFLIDPRTI